jgi:hypothetical protein
VFESINKWVKVSKAVFEPNVVGILLESDYTNQISKIPIKTIKNNPKNHTKEEIK